MRAKKFSRHMNQQKKFFPPLAPYMNPQEAVEETAKTRVQREVCGWLSWRDFTWECQRTYLVCALEANEWSVTKTARALGIWPHYVNILKAKFALRRERVLLKKPDHDLVASFITAGQRLVPEEELKLYPVDWVARRRYYKEWKRERKAFGPRG